VVDTEILMMGPVLTFWLF